MNIGLMTVYFADYGSFFHAYAMQQYLQSQGHTCEIINANTRMLHSPRLAAAAVGTKMLPQNVKKEIADRVNMYRTYLTLQEEVKRLNVSPPVLRMKSFSKRYDCVVIGSDELWSITNPRMRFVPAYFGYDISCPVISYSTSGITLNNPSERQLSIMKKGLETFRDIAVRDRFTADWVGKLLGREIEIVLDPTLLNPCFAGRPRESEPYILVYGEHFSESQVFAIKQYSKARKMPVYSVSWKHAWCDRSIAVTSAAELQDYYRNCFYCFTSTFHGTIFAVVNQVDFTSFQSELRGRKVRELIDQLGLSERLVENGENFADLAPVDYSAVNRHLATLRVRSEHYLRNALEKVEKESR